MTTVLGFWYNRTMDIEAILQEIGLNKKEAKVYVALLQLGQDTAFHIAGKTGLKRPTIYVVLEHLKGMGLVSSSKSKKAELFSPVEPRKLYNLFKEKEAKLNEALPSLEAIYNIPPQKPRVEMFEGLEGVKAVYYDVVEYLKKGDEILFFSTLEHTDYLKESFKLWKRILRQNKNTRAREIMRDTAVERAFAEEMGRIKDRYKIRFIPKELGEIHSDLIIFGNKVAIVSVKTDIYATVIEDEEIANSYRVFYEMAWKSGKI